MQLLKLELGVLSLLAAIRDANFYAYVKSFMFLVPWISVLDHMNCARWLSIHIRDMITLEAKHPHTYSEFVKGCFVAKRSASPFSAMALDQAYEKKDVLIKGDGGAVGFTDYPSVLRRWMITEPEVSRLIQDIEK